MKPYAGSDFQLRRGLRKKAQEMRIASGALLRLGLTGFDLTPHERPDVLVDFKNANVPVRLGCEIQTLQADNVASGSPLREFESRWVRVITRVVETLRGDNAPVPYCTVLFRDPSYTSLRSTPDAQLISEFVVAGRLLRNAPALGFPQADTPALNSILTEIRVIERDGQDCLWWPAHLQAGMVTPLDCAIVDAVGKKSDRAASYAWLGCAEKWLLLVAEGRGLTDVIGHARKIDLPRTPLVPFTLVLVWDRFTEDIWTIHPQYEVICDSVRQLRKRELLPETLQRFYTGAEVYSTRLKAR